jgi:uncharacterized MAPEG superfamily protein
MRTTEFAPSCLCQAMMFVLAIQLLAAVRYPDTASLDPRGDLARARGSTAQESSAAHTQASLTAASIALARMAAHHRGKHMSCLNPCRFHVLWLRLRLNLGPLAAQSSNLDFVAVSDQAFAPVEALPIETAGGWRPMIPKTPLRHKC